MKTSMLSLLLAVAVPVPGVSVADDAPPAPAEQQVDAAPDSAAVMGDLTPAQKPAEIDEFTALQTPPPGSPEDQALWRRGKEIGIQATYERWRTLDLRVALRQKGVLQRLSDIALKSPPEKQKSLAELIRRIEAAEKFAGALRDARWPVDPTRVCGYPVLQFGSAMGNATTPKMQANLALVRIKLDECATKAEGATSELKRANDALEAALKDAMKILDASGPAPGGRQGRNAAAAPAAKGQ